MRVLRRIALLATPLALLAPGGAGNASADTAAASQRHATCAGRGVVRLHLSRLPGPKGRLSWQAASRAAQAAGPTYLVERAGRKVGQTTGDSLVLRITPGRMTAFTVRARYAGSAAACSATLRVALPFRAPGHVRGLRLLRLTGVGAVIAWRPASRGDAPVAGYRVERDGAVVGQTHGLHFALKLSPGTAHRITVLAADTRGHLGTATRALRLSAHGGRVVAGTPPSAPAGLAASEVSSAGATVSWVPSRPGASAVAGYRVYRDGHLVGQTSQPSMRLTRLAFPHTYAITVSAVDTAKREGPAAGPLRLSTTHVAPQGPTQLGALNVTDTSATLAWNGGEANSGTLTGYELFKDGAAVGVIHGQNATVALASERQYVFVVRALDSAGFLSAPSPSLTVVTSHTPPSTPTNLAAGAVSGNSIALSWSPSTPVSGRIVGYRVFRDGVPVGQVSGPQLTLQGLAPATRYAIRVTAVDSLGAISAPTAPLDVTTAEPVPTHGTGQAFLLASTDQSFRDLEAHYQQLGVVYPTYFECGVGGTVSGHDDPLVTGWAVARRVAVLPRLNCQNINDENQILNEPAARQTMIETLAALCREHGYQGIQIDFEGAAPAERNPFTTFITMLAEKLHSQGDKLSTVVTAKYYNVPTGRAAMYDDAALSVPSDWLFVLDWGLHWTTSGPGSIDEYSWFKKVAEYTATLPNR